MKRKPTETTSSHFPEAVTKVHRSADFLRIHINRRELLALVSGENESGANKAKQSCLFIDVPPILKAEKTIKKNNKTKSRRHFCD